MSQPQPRPARCGNDPRAQLTDGDRQAVAEFRQYLADRKAQLAPLDLDAIQARYDAATPGLWYEQPKLGPYFIASEHAGYEHGIGDMWFGDGDQADADLTFVLNARQDITALLARVRQLEAENARLADVGRRALASLDGLIRDHQDPGAEALGARFQLAQALTGHPHACSNCDGIDPASCLTGTPPADLTGWGVGLAEDGLEPYDGTLTIDVGGQPFLRTHLAFSSAADERDRENFTTRLGQIILREL